MITDRLKFLKTMSYGDKIDFEFPFFMLYLRSTTSGTLTRFVLLTNAADKIIFKYIGIFLNKILTLSREWRYPQAKASEIVSEEAPTEDFSNFLYKLSQSISSGETINDFIDREYKSYTAEYDAQRSESILQLKNLSDAYLPLMSVTLFLCTTMLISSIFYDAEVMIMLTIFTVIIISFLLYILSWLIFKSAKPESVLIDEQEEKAPNRQKIELLTAVCLFLALGSILIPMNPFWHLVVIGFMIMIPGAVGKYYISRIHQTEDDYPAFFRYLSSNLTVDIPLTDVLFRATETDFGSLNTPIKSLVNKLKMRVPPKVAWWSFETELDSKLIRRINLIMTDTLATGGDLSFAAKYMEDFFHKYTSIRRQRYSACGYHVGIALPLYFVMCTLFAIVYGFFTSLEEIIIKMSTVVDLLQIPSLEFMEMFFIFTIVMFALNNVFSIYNMEGDSRFTIAFYFGLQLTVGSGIYALVSSLVSNVLSSIGTL